MANQVVSLSPIIKTDLFHACGIVFVLILGHDIPQQGTACAQVTLAKRLHRAPSHQMHQRQWAGGITQKQLEK